MFSGPSPQRGLDDEAEVGKRLDILQVCGSKNLGRTPRIGTLKHIHRSSGNVTIH